jgi:hypothetical protein
MLKVSQAPDGPWGELNLLFRVFIGFAEAPDGPWGELNLEYLDAGF